MRNNNKTDKKKLLRQLDHLTLPPRLEGKVKNVKMNPIRKKKKILKDKHHSKIYLFTARVK